MPTLFAFFYTHRGKTKFAACSPAARVKGKRRTWSIRWTAKRGGYIEKYFHVEWPHRSIYHLMVNTGVGDELVAQTILNFMKSLESKNIPQ